MYVRFAIKDLFSQRFICSILFLLFFFVSVAVFSGSIFERGAVNGTELTKKRLGSDIIIVPSEYGNDVQNSLFEGKACTVNLDSDWGEKLSTIEGVNRVSAQRYIATLNAECCSAGGIQMIAYDPKTDFTVGTWLSEQNITAPKTDEIIVGSEAGFEQGQTVSFFGREFKVIGVLDHTGMGYDSSAFISFDSAREIAATDGYSMVFPSEDGKEQVSMLLIDVDPNHTPEEIKESITKKYAKEGISAYSITSLVSVLVEKLSGIGTLVTVFNVFLLITAGIIKPLSASGHPRTFDISRSYFRKNSKTDLARVCICYDRCCDKCDNLYDSFDVSDGVIFTQHGTDAVCSAGLWCRSVVCAENIYIGCDDSCDSSCLCICKAT